MGGECEGGRREGYAREHSQQRHEQPSDARAWRRGTTGAGLQAQVGHTSRSAKSRAPTVVGAAPTGRCHPVSLGAGSVNGRMAERILWVVVCSGESALGAVEEATAEANNQAPRSEPMEALVAEGKAMLEQG